MLGIKYHDGIDDEEREKATAVDECRQTQYASWSRLSVSTLYCIVFKLFGASLVPVYTCAE